MAPLYIDSISCPVTNLGPGRRLAIWVDGCSLACKGCLSVSLWARKESTKVSVEVMFNQLLKAAPSLDGVTITGGEPFEQVEGLCKLVRLIKRYTNLDVMVYSGYTLQELASLGAAAKNLLSLIDILVDGRFEENTTNKKLWRGSDNQQIHLLSGRSQKYAHYIDMEYDQTRPLHLEMQNDNTFKIVGIPDRRFVKTFFEKCNGVGIGLTRLRRSKR